MGNFSAATAPTSNAPNAVDPTGAATLEWIEAWKTVILAEMLSAVTRCEEIVLDPLLMHF